MKVRVLHVISSFGMGGAETWLLRLVQYWKSNYPGQVEVHFLATSGMPGLLDEEVKATGAEIFYLPLDKQNILSFLPRFRQLLKKYNYNAIHDHQDFLSGWHFLFGIKVLPPVRIAHVHNPSYQIKENYGVSSRRRLQQKAGEYLVKNFATHIAGTSTQILKEYGFYPDRYEHQWIGAVHCSFNTSDWSGNHAVNKQSLCEEFGWPAETKIVLFAGRLDSSLDVNHPKNHKNSVFALNVLQKLQERNVKMIMAGQNDYVAKEFRELITQRGLSDRVLLLGVRKDITRLMLGSDLLFFPSRAEGLGMVTVEAQAAGLPVLASDAVPHECNVLVGFVQFLSLSLTHEQWAKKMQELLSSQRGDSTEADPAWEKTDFNIHISAVKLLNLYSAGHYKIAVD